MRPISARTQLRASQSFQFDGDDFDHIGDAAEAGHRVGTEGDELDQNDAESLFSESVLEREGVTRNPHLILPEVDDDAFFEL